MSVCVTRPLYHPRIYSGVCLRLAELWRRDPNRNCIHNPQASLSVPLKPWISEAFWGVFEGGALTDRRVHTNTYFEY